MAVQACHMLIMIIAMGITADASRIQPRRHKQQISSPSSLAEVGSPSFQDHAKPRPPPSRALAALLHVTHSASSFQYASARLGGSYVSAQSVRRAPLDPNMVIEPELLTAGAAFLAGVVPMSVGLAQRQQELDSAQQQLKMAEEREQQRTQELENALKENQQKQQQLDDMQRQLNMGEEREQQRTQEFESTLKEKQMIVDDIKTKTQELEELGEQYRQLSDALESSQDAGTQYQEKLSKAEAALQKALSELDVLDEKVKALDLKLEEADFKLEQAEQRSLRNRIKAVWQFFRRKQKNKE